MTDFDVDGEECPMGDACAIHFRNDESNMNDEGQFGRIISYVGEWCVVTDDNQDPIAQIKMEIAYKLGVPLKDGVHRYETTVTHVGSGALGDLYEEPRGTLEAATRYLVTHNTWENFQEAHDMVVTAVEQSLINLESSIFSLVGEAAPSGAA